MTGVWIFIQYLANQVIKCLFGICIQCATVTSWTIWCWPTGFCRLHTSTFGRCNQTVDSPDTVPVWNLSPLFNINQVLVKMYTGTCILENAKRCNQTDWLISLYYSHLKWSETTEKRNWHMHKTSTIPIIIFVTSWSWQCNINFKHYSATRYEKMWPN